MEPSPRLTLVSMAFSPYNIYACWALERAGLRVERLVRVLPLLHMPVVGAALWWRGVRPRAADRTSSPLGTPLLFVSGTSAGGAVRALLSSAEIVAFADGAGGAGAGGLVFPNRAPLAPAEASAEREFVARCEERLGPATRLWAYSYVLYDARAFLWTGLGNAGPLTAALWVLLSPLLAPAMRSALGVWGRDARRRAAEERLREEFARASARLAVPPSGDAGAGARGGAGAGAGSGQRRFLFGDTFGPADLAFAALGFFAIGLSAQDVACGALRGAASTQPLDALPREWRAFALELRETPAGQHILRMVREERGSARGGANA